MPSNKSKPGKPKKGKPKTPSRGIRKEARRGIAMGGSGAGGFSSLPVARSFSSSRASYFKVAQLPMHPTYGAGIRVSGCEVALNVVTAAAGFDFFTASVATALTVNTMTVSPDSFNGRLALQARTYARFRFRKLTAHFVPQLGSTNPGMAAVAYSPDGAANSFATLGYAATTQIVPSLAFSLNAPVSIDLLNYRGDELWYTELDNASTPGARMTQQGVVIGFPSVNNLGVLTHGGIWVEYEVELYAPSTDYGFTYSVNNEAERLAARAAINRVRRLEEERLIEKMRATRLSPEEDEAVWRASQTGSDDDYDAVSVPKGTGRPRISRAGSVA